MSLSVCAFAHLLNANLFYVLRCIFSSSNEYRVHLSRDVRTHFRIFAYEYSSICTMPRFTSRLPLFSKYQLTFLWSDMFRLPPMNPVGERGSSLHAPQNSNANHPCRSQQSVQLREKKAARHQQARAIPAGRLSSLCCPPNSICTGIDWMTLFAINIVFLSLIYSNRKQL